MIQYILLIVAAPATYLLTKFMARVIERLGYVGVDIFKLDKPVIPSLGGIPILIMYSILMYLLYLAGFVAIDVFAAVVLACLIAGFVGLLDDLYDMPGYFKPLACLLAGLPIILFGTYIPRLYFPLGVSFRITYIYILLILVGVSVSANTVNMLDVVNGSALIGTLVVLVTLALSAVIIDPSNDILPLLALLSVLAGFLPHNIYPSKIFIGNVGALFLGAAVASFAIIYKVEFQAVVAMLPFIHNSFFFMNKFRRFVEHKRLNYRVTELGSDGLIGDAGDPNAPVTLVRLLVAPNRLSELDVVLNITLLFIFSSILAMLSLLWWWV